MCVNHVVITARFSRAPVSSLFQGSTNLHLDMSDAVNCLAYVGIPKDSKQTEEMEQVYRQIDQAGKE